MDDERCYYEWPVISDDDDSYNFDLLRPPKEKVVFEIYHGSSQEREHELIRIVSYPEFLTIWELTECVIDYCELYFTSDPDMIQKTLHRVGL
jgi:hypothetical protein